VTASETLGTKRTAWWRTQSQSNQSPLRNSLLTGKRTGIISILGLFSNQTPKLVQRFWGLRAKFPTHRSREFLNKSREFPEPIRENSATVITALAPILRSRLGTSLAHQFIDLLDRLRELVAHVDEFLGGGDLLSPGQEQKDIQHLV
jgi:hypothetical protein